jgi:uncharacterized phiE125 gp8 family phage protein
MASRRTVAPTRTALTLEEAIEHLRLEPDAQDLPLVLALCQAADDHVEGVLRRALCMQTWQLTLDEFPCAEYSDEAVIELPFPPLVSVTSLAYVDRDGAPQTLAAPSYQIDTAGFVGRVAPAYGTFWPSTRNQLNAVTVTYVAGYGDPADVPPAIKSALRLMLGHLYENREAVVTGTIATQLPLAVDALLAPYRVREFV